MGSKAELLSTVVGMLLAGVMTSMGQTERIGLSRQQVSDIAPPSGYARVEADPGTFAEWLRRLPLKPDTARVRLYNGELKQFQAASHRVLDLDIGTTDLQQCADAAMRLRAEYLFSVGRHRDIAFNFTSGDPARFARWIDGWRPIVDGNKVTWKKPAAVDSSFKNLQTYLNTVFMYAGSFSLERELKLVPNVADIRPGDCFIQGGFPGHVIIVIDAATNATTGERAILLAQGFTPAQDIHVLTNLNDATLNPWYRVGDGDILETPQWTFRWGELYRFPE